MSLTLPNRLAAEPLRLAELLFPTLLLYSFRYLPHTSTAAMMSSEAVLPGWTVWFVAVVGGLGLTLVLRYQRVVCWWRTGVGMLILLAGLVPPLTVLWPLFSACLVAIHQAGGVCLAMAGVYIGIMGVIGVRFACWLLADFPLPVDRYSR